MYLIWWLLFLTPWQSNQSENSWELPECTITYQTWCICMNVRAQVDEKLVSVSSIKINVSSRAGRRSKLNLVRGSLRRVYTHTHMHVSNCSPTYCMNTYVARIYVQDQGKILVKFKQSWFYCLKFLLHIQSVQPSF